MSLDWLENRDPDKPFCLLYHHKAPHRPWDPDDKHAHLYDERGSRSRTRFSDDYANRASAAAAARPPCASSATSSLEDLKVAVPEGLTMRRPKWKYQRYIKDYLRCVASVDDNVGRVLDRLDEQGLSDNTIVIYTSDQGFFLGDHGWYDKRFMYEESLRMPFVVRYPRRSRPAASTTTSCSTSTSRPCSWTWPESRSPFRAGCHAGRSFRPLLQGQLPDDWQTSMYYRYWMHMGTTMSRPTTACATNATS